MKNITTYSARRTNLFTWLATIMMVASLVARIVFSISADMQGVLVVVVRLILPVVANLLIIVRLPLRGEKFFYVTVRPVVLFAIYFIVVIFSYNMSVAMTIACLLFCIIQAVCYYLTFTGKIGSKIPVLLAYLVFMAIAAMDQTFRGYFVWYMNVYLSYLISDVAILLGIVFMILAAKRLPDPVDGEPYRPRYGDRMDGRLIRSTPPITKVAPYIMVNRNGASNFITDSVEVSNMEKYIHQKRRDGYKHFGITHVFLAAYVRCCAEFPALNRFLSGQKIYHRYQIEVNMIVKKSMEVDSPDTAIKVVFDPEDTATDVYEKFDAKVQGAKESMELSSGFDNVAQIINYIPGLFLKFVIWLLKTLDYLSLLSVELCNVSPFHGSMFITSMGSLGIPPIYHHLYDFGNVSQFCAFGAKRTVKSISPEGEEIVKKYVDYNWVTDERVVDGFYYASVLKRMRSLLAHPEQLDEIPEVKEDIE